MVDLSDENGNLKYLRGHPESYATEFLKNRESLVLVRVNSEYIFVIINISNAHYGNSASLINYFL